MTTSAVLQAAKHELLTRGWCQGILRARDGRVCALGAIEAVFRMHWNVQIDPAAHLLAYVASGRVGSLVRWNDHPDRTPEDVLNAFDAAIAIAETQERRLAEAAASPLVEMEAS